MKRSKLLNKLWEFQNKYGYIPNNAIVEISEKLNISNIEIEGVISFYHFFHRKPTGKYIIYLNNSIVSEFKGFSEVKVAFEKETGCTFNKYDNNSLFSLFETSCIGLSDQEPAALINFYPFTNLTPESVHRIVNSLKKYEPLDKIASNPKSNIQYIPPEEKTIFFRKYIAGNSIKKIKNLSPIQVLNSVASAKLDGRGGAFFPSAIKWKACKEAKNTKKYIICNADEGEPGTFKDKSLLENYPGLILEGILLAAYVTGATKGIIYLRAEYKYLQKKIEQTIHEFKESNFLGKSILNNKKFNFNIQLILGAGAYVCGAETALMESAEGKRGEPRNRIYLPTQVGYLGYPTVVNNVETLAMAARIIELEAETISKIGTNESKGTKILSISGDVAKPGIYEIEWGTTVKEILQLSQATAPRFVQISGPSGTCINESEFNRKICKEDLICGGSIMVFNRNRSILHILENFSEFFKRESCGACTSCRAGTQILFEKIKKIKKGICTLNDLDEVNEWAQIIKLTSKCGLGQTAANTFQTSLIKFKDYFNGKVELSKDNLNVEFDMESAVSDYDNLIKNTQH